MLFGGEKKGPDAHGNRPFERITVRCNGRLSNLEGQGDPLGHEC